MSVDPTLSPQHTALEKDSQRASGSSGYCRSSSNVSKQSSGYLSCTVPFTHIRQSSADSAGIFGHHRYWISQFCDTVLFFSSKQTANTKLVLLSFHSTAIAFLVVVLWLCLPLATEGVMVSSYPCIHDHVLTVCEHVSYKPHVGISPYLQLRCRPGQR